MTMSEDREQPGASGTIVTFYSYKGGTGRTMALANVGWILASQGYRVLAVDWDLESPGLYKYFHPFLDQDTLSSTHGVIDLINDYAWAVTSARTPREPDWHRAYARIMPHTLPLKWAFQKDGELAFLSAGRQNRDYSSLISSMDWDNFYDRLGGGQFFEALRAEMKRYYDFILIDSRTGLSDIADICTVQMPDVLVNCFTLSTQSIDGAAAIARYIDERYSFRNIRILPVPMRIENAENEKVEAGRALARARFAGFPKGLDRREANRYWLGVEVPHRAFYAFEETLATFGDMPGSHGTLLAAYERLARAITGGTGVADYPAMEEDLRVATLRLFTRQRPAPVSEVVLSYVSVDRPWADWTRLVLERHGLRVCLHCADSQPADVIASLLGSTDEGKTTRAVVLLSTSYADSPDAARIWDAIKDTPPTSAVQRDPLVLRLPHTRLEGAYADVDALDFSDANEEQAASSLLAALDRAGPPSERPEGDDTASTGPRFPWPQAQPAISNVPARNPRFAGRGGLMEELRNGLLDGSSMSIPHVLHGQNGVGTTQIAIEYAHRFKADYDLVWWVSAEQLNQITVGLEELDRLLGHGVRANVADSARRACDALRRGDPHTRWLLIYDGAVDPQQLESYLPGGTGHVLITSHREAWSQVAISLEVGTFSAEESDANLMSQVPWLTSDEARRIGERLGFLPLAEAQAVAWLQATKLPADLYLSQFRSHPRPAGRGRVEPASLPVSPQDAESLYPAIRIAFELLSQSSKAAARLLELCAFCAPDPDTISLDLIYRDEMARLLVDFDKTLREKSALAKVVSELGRSELATVDQANKNIRVTRMVADFVRSRMTPEERARACSDVHSVLVGVLPSGGTENPQNWDKYDRILPHIAPSRAVEAQDDATVQLLIELVRYQWKRNRFDEAEELGQELAAKWAVNLGEDHWQRLYLQSQLANVLRSKGHYTEALELDALVFSRQQAIIGDDHPHTWITAGGVAADLRALGRFRDALDWDKKIHQRLRELLTDDHPRTLSAANNLAVSHRLMGDFKSARALDQATLVARAAVLGPDQPDTLLSSAYLAQDMREAGEFTASIELLRQTLDRYRAVVRDTTIDILRIEKSLAVSMRRAGQREEAHQLAERTYLLYQDAFPDTPDAAAAALEQASCLSAVGNKQNAYDIARSVLSTQTSELGHDHPYTLAAATNLTGYLLGTRQHDDAYDLGRRTLAQLQETLGESHPFVLNCAINVASALARLNRYEDAAALEESTFELLKQTLGENHPDTLICQINLSLTLQSLDRQDEEQRAGALRMREQALGKLRLSLGASHPAVADAEAGKRLYRDLEWQPI